MKEDPVNIWDVKHLWIWPWKPVEVAGKMQYWGTYWQLKMRDKHGEVVTVNDTNHSFSVKSDMGIFSAGFWPM